MVPSSGAGDDRVCTPLSAENHPMPQGKVSRPFREGEAGYGVQSHLKRTEPSINRLTPFPGKTFQNREETDSSGQMREGLMQPCENLQWPLEVRTHSASPKPDSLTPRSPPIPEGLNILSRPKLLRVSRSDEGPALFAKAGFQHKS